MKTYFLNSTNPQTMTQLIKKSAFILLCILGITLATNNAHAEDCIRFNPDNIEIVPYTNGQYRIIEGGTHAMFLFPNYAEAKMAYTIIKKYRITNSCFVGRPGPSFKYLLVGNKSPQGKISGEDCIPFNPNNIKVVCIKGRWKIVEGSHWIFDFGNKRSEAYESYKIIKKYGFTQSCYVGRANPSFQYLRKSATVSNLPSIDGTYVNTDSNTRGLTTIKIKGNGTQFTTWGACHPSDCAWGTTRLKKQGSNTYNVYYDQDFATRKISVTHITPHGNMLKVIMHTSYTDSRKDRKDTFYFKRSTVATLNFQPVVLKPFDF